MQPASLSEVAIAASSEAWRPFNANDPQVVPKPKDGVRKKSFPDKLASIQHFLKWPESNYQTFKVTGIPWSGDLVQTSAVQGPRSWLLQEADELVRSS